MTRPIFARGMGTSPAGPTGPAGAAGPAGPAGANGGTDASTADNVTNGTATKAALSSAYAPKAATYASGVAYVVGQLVVSGTTLYRVTTAHTSSGAINLSNFATAGGGGGTAATTTFTPAGSIAATDVQAAIVEVASEAYTKPGTGIPATDLAAAVQTSLGKADTAVQSSLYNANPTNLRRFIGAMNRQTAGAGACKIVCIGDSIMSGQFASSPINTYSAPARLGQFLGSSSRYTPLVLGAVYFNDLLNSQTVRDSRITSAGSWVQGNSGPAYGGATGNNTASPLTINFTGADTFIASFARYGGGGTISLQVDSETPVTVSTGTGTGNIATLSVTSSGGVGTHTLKINATGGADVYLHGVRGYNNVTKTGVEVSKCAQPGLGSNQLGTDLGFGGLSALNKGITHDLHIVMIGTNDASGGATPASLGTNVTATATALLTVGDVLLVVPPPQRTTTYADTAAKRLPFDQALYGVANALNLPLIDMNKRWNYDFDTYNADPTDYLVDGAHLTDMGYADLGRTFATALLSLA